MRYFTIAFVFLLLCIASVDAMAGFGRSGSSGGFRASSYSARSYSAPARTYSSYSAPRSSYHPAPTVVHHTHTTSGGSGGGFMSSFVGGAAGAAVGNVLTAPRAAVVSQPVVTGPAAVAAQQQAVMPVGQDVVVKAPAMTTSYSNENTIITIVMVLLGLVAITGIVHFMRKH